MRTGVKREAAVAADGCSANHGGSTEESHRGLRASEEEKRIVFERAADIAL